MLFPTPEVASFLSRLLDSFLRSDNELQPKDGYSSSRNLVLLMPDLLGMRLTFNASESSKFSLGTFGVCFSTGLWLELLRPL